MSFFTFTPPSNEDKIREEFRTSVLLDNEPTCGSFFESSKFCPGIHFSIVGTSKLDRLTPTLFKKFTDDYINSLTIVQQGYLNNIMRRNL